MKVNELINFIRLGIKDMPERKDYEVHNDTMTGGDLISASWHDNLSILWLEEVEK